MDGRGAVTRLDTPARWATLSRPPAEHTVPLDQNQQNTILNWLAARAPEHGCPVCGKGPMQLGSELVSAPLLVVGPGGGHTFDPVRGATFVTLMCQHCGNTRFFSATRIGVAK